MEEKCGNIVLFPFMAQGHLNPFIDLAHLLISRNPNLTVTIVSTPANVLNMRTLFSTTPSVRLAELPFRSSDHGLPPNIEHTHTLSRSAISHLYRASQSLQPALHRLISSIAAQSDGGPPLLSIVSDMFLAWSVDVARSFGVFHAVLYTSGPYAMSIYNSIWTHFPHTLTCADELTLPDLPGITIRRSQLSNKIKAATGPDSASAVFVQRQAEYCRRSDASLWNTLAVLERRSLEDWERSTAKPVWPIGPLNHARRHQAGPDPGLPAEACATWLDRHRSRSAVYVSFGSQSRIGRAQTAELAKGLEASGRPFVWAINEPIGSDAAAKDDPDLGLPPGFEDRVRDSGQGLLVRRWAPQMEILSHESTGAFVSHCGWNSVVESLWCGVPVIGWPLASEQFYNAKLLEEELGVLHEIARGEEEMIGEDDVVRVLKEVLEGERGREMKKRAEVLREEMKCAVEDEKGSSILALDEFVRTVMARRWPSG